jgi:hypothetical protein
MKTKFLGYAGDAAVLLKGKTVYFADDIQNGYFDNKTDMFISVCDMDFGTEFTNEEDGEWYYRFTLKDFENLNKMIQKEQKKGKK